MIAAFVLIQVSGMAGVEDMRALHNRLQQVEGVKTVHFVTGPTDVIVFIEASDQAALGQTLGKIRSLQGVASTDTRIVLPL